METVDELLGTLLPHPIEEVIRQGLHEHLDRVQQRPCGVTDEIGRAFFGQPPVPPAQAHVQ
ncbi:MAG TPA: hypothetical protein VGE72_28580 [Azospirillum sp.]